MANQYGSPDINRAALWQVLDTIWDYNPAATSTEASIDLDVDRFLLMLLFSLSNNRVSRQSNSWKRARFANRIRDILPTVRRFAAPASLLGSKGRFERFELHRAIGLN
jgi:hypothetical protein